MSNPSESREKLLDPSAAKAFRQLAIELREALLDEAVKSSPDGTIISPTSSLDFLFRITGSRYP